MSLHGSRQQVQNKDREAANLFFSGLPHRQVDFWQQPTQNLHTMQLPIHKLLFQILHAKTMDLIPLYDTSLPTLNGKWQPHAIPHAIEPIEMQHTSNQALNNCFDFSRVQLISVFHTNTHQMQKEYLIEKNTCRPNTF